MNLHLLGIRHHGVGSAQNVLARLEELRPDLVLIEGPPELTEVLHWVADRHLVPPVAVLAYQTDNPKRASFYPFVEYSPEWVATKWAFAHDVPVRTLDLPLTHALALEETQEKKEPETHVHTDPLEALAKTAGFDNYHAWWEIQFEQNFEQNQSAAHFEAVFLAMQAARETQPNPAENELREAFMRHELRQAAKDNAANVAVVCGAWHAPALLHWQSSQIADEALIKNLARVRVRTTWIPWTNERMGWWSGYGAGIQSPGWYEHRWQQPNDNGVAWLTRVARLFRENKMDISTAHVIEAFRLAKSLAALRGQARVGLQELNEATQAVMCMGDSILLRLVEQELTVAHRLGSVPDTLPKLPLQADFEAVAKKLRLTITEETKPLELDLRKETDLARSVFLHQLLAFDMAWGQKTVVSNKGTFKEGWVLQWQPNLLLKLIEKAIWGNQVADAATAFVSNIIQNAQQLDPLSRLIEAVIPAELFGILDVLLLKINELAAATADIQALMQMVVPLANVSRYGNVRRTDATAIGEVVTSLLTRVCVGLPAACHGLDEQNAQRLFENIKKTDAVLRLLGQSDLLNNWQKALETVANTPALPPMLLGGTTRVLFDSQFFDQTEIEKRFGLALSAGQIPAYSASWLEGFLKGSGLVMLYDEKLWQLLYNWVATLDEANFAQLLPLLRRTFSAFEPAERRQLGEKAKQQENSKKTPDNEILTNEKFNQESAEKSLEIIKLLLGM